MNITEIEPADFDELLSLWEQSVRATHHFLSEERIRLLRPVVRR